MWSSWGRDQDRRDQPGLTHKKPGITREAPKSTARHCGALRSTLGTRGRPENTSSSAVNSAAARRRDYPRRGNNNNTCFLRFLRRRRRRRPRRRRLCHGREQSGEKLERWSRRTEHLTHSTGTLRERTLRMMRKEKLGASHHRDLYREACRLKGDRGARCAAQGRPARSAWPAARNANSTTLHRCKNKKNGKEFRGIVLQKLRKTTTKMFFFFKIKK